MLKDKLLIWRLNRGDTDALHAIYMNLKDDLLRISSSLLADRADAEDIVHEVFVDFAAGAASFVLTGSLKGYLAKCVVNKARNLNRSKTGQAKNNIDDLDECVCTTERPDKWIINYEQSEQIRGILGKLPYQQREAIVLHIQGGLKFREIARVQNTSIKTVQSRYRYGLKKLRSLFYGEASK